MKSKLFSEVLSEAEIMLDKRMKKLQLIQKIIKNVKHGKYYQKRN
jgi:hypothetical protein